MPAPTNLLDRAKALALGPRATPAQLKRSEAGGLRWYEDAARESYLLGVYEWYRGETLRHVDQMPGESYREAQSREGRLFLNWFARFIDLWCATYSAEPTRTFYLRSGSQTERLTDKAQIAALQRLYDVTEVDRHMGALDRDLRLGGNGIIRPVADLDNREVAIHRYTSPSIRVVQNTVNPRRPWATVLIGDVAEFDQDASYTKIPVAEVWTQDSFTLMRGATVVESRPIPYNPLVHCFERTPDNLTGYFVPAPGVALAEATHRFNNDFLSQFGSILLMQGHGQMLIFGKDNQAALTIGPKRAIEFSGDPDKRQGVEFAAPNAPLADWRESLVFLIDQIRECAGIPSSMIDVKTDASGAAIIQANAPTAEIRAARLKDFRLVETELCRALVREAQAIGFDGLQGLNADELDVSVSYEKPAASASVQDRIALEKHDIELGIETPASLLFARKPDQFDSVADAEQYLAGRAQPEEPDAEPDENSEISIDNEDER
jgi:hypothetical protein